jgi:flagellar basal-body rod modification protein FlgD
MTVSSVFSAANVPATSTQASAGGGLGSLGSNDFLKLMLAQMQQQDPLEPMDNKDMLAQMAQFSSLSNQTEMNSTLKQIAEKLGIDQAALGAASS